MAGVSPGTVFLSFMAAAVQLCLLLLVVALSFRSGWALRRFWRTGLVLGLVCLALGVPHVVLQALYFDLTKLTESGQVPPEIAGLRGVVTALAAIVSAGLTVLLVPWRMLVYCVAGAQWGESRPSPLVPPGEAGRIAPGRLAAAFAGGILLAALMWLAFRLLGRPGAAPLGPVRGMFGGLEQAAPSLRAGATLLAVCSAAIAQELGFRGVLLGSLLRRDGVGAHPAIATACVALAWGLVRLVGAEPSWTGFVAACAVGAGLCELARRQGLAAAIAARIALDLTGAVLVIAVPA